MTRAQKSCARRFLLDAQIHVPGRLPRGAPRLSGGKKMHAIAMGKATWGHAVAMGGS